jgi:hypothetical protein
VGIGLIVLLLALAIVLVLSARRSAEVSQAAVEVLQPGSPDGESSPVEGGGRLPGLDDMKRSTSGHTQRVEEVLEGTADSGEDPRR